MSAELAFDISDSDCVKVAEIVTPEEITGDTSTSTTWIVQIATHQISPPAVGDEFDNELDLWAQEASESLNELENDLE
jgi:hypothetical protein